MSNFQDEDIEIIYWGEEEDNSTVDAEKHTKYKKKKREEIDWKEEIVSWIRLVILAVIIAIVINNFIIINAEVPSGSMYPTIKEHSRMIGFRLAYVFDEPKIGDIVIFKFPDNEEENFVKRVIAKEGDFIEIKAGITYVNDERIDESGYIYYLGGFPDRNDNFPKTQVPEGCYFVMGDNRNNSNDSRTWKTTHFVSRDEILGEAVFSYYPDLKVLK